MYDSDDNTVNCGRIKPAVSIITPASGTQRLLPEQEALVRRHLEELMTCRAFAVSKRAQDLLRLIVGHALAGETDCLRERMIGAEMFNRPVGYDTANDSVVRVKVTELRKKLSQAYLESAKRPAVIIELLPGSYVPKFVFQQPELSLSDIQLLTQPSMATPGLASSKTNAAVLPPEPAKSILRRYKGFAIAASLIALLTIGSGAAWQWRNYLNSRSEVHSIAILPLENLSGDSNQEYLADGITEELIDDLGQMSSLRVISRTSVMSFKGTRKDLPTIARELSVDRVVEGSVLRTGSEIHIMVRLVDPKTDRRIWGESFTRNLTDVVATEGDLAQSIANELSLNVSPQTQAHLSREKTVNVTAEDLYLQGLLALHVDDCDTAMKYFQQAIQADPRFASAYAAMAISYGRLGTGGWMPYAKAYANQKSYAEHAIEVDSSLSEGHSELASAIMNVNWDWAGAEKEFQQAIALNPNSATVHDQYGSFLELRGNPSAAIKETHIAVTLDPLSGRALSDLAYTYYFARQYDQALSLMDDARAKFSDVHPDVFAFGVVYVEKGMYPKAIDMFLRQGDNPHALGHLGNAYARAGQTVQAQKIIGELENRVQKDGVGAYEIALVYAGLGQKDKAFAWLREAVGHHDRGLLYLKVDPPLDPLRSDSRFNELETQVGLLP